MTKHTFKTRFAPSPTGLMHFGNLRTALFNYLYAKRVGGAFVLRVEDTDTARSELQYRDAILTDLKWLGLEWDEGPYYQSERQAVYDEYYAALLASGHAYPCFCSDEKLAIARKTQLSRGEPPRYPGTCRALTPEQIAEFEAKGIPATLRFRVQKGGVVEFNDLIKGPQRFENDHIGDFIIRRGDKSASFMFCNAIDDAMMGVTHALRGDDHLTNTPRQIMILQTLKLPLPSYGHFPTILGPDSRPLSKRNGSRSIQELREHGYHIAGILNYLSRLGHYDEDRTLLNLTELAQHFDLTRISKAPAHYDVHQLNYWQTEAMHRATTPECWKMIAPYVEKQVPPQKQIAFVETIQQNIIMPQEAEMWAKAIFAETLDYSAEAQEVLHKTEASFFHEAAKAAECASYADFISELQKTTSLKGKALFAPVRAALTGHLHGPELAKILDLLGRDHARDRFLKAEKYASKDL